MSEYVASSKTRRAVETKRDSTLARLADQRAHALPLQLRDQRTSGGLPQPLAQGIESLSGISMSHVRVHYNSAKPAQMQAHAYAQGSDIHLASGQEQHLPHEAWHVVQQAQGRVKPTLQMNGVSINDNTGLESEADSMGHAALRAGGS